MEHGQGQAKMPALFDYLCKNYLDISEHSGQSVQPPKSYPLLPSWSGFFIRRTIALPHLGQALPVAAAKA